MRFDPVDRAIIERLQIDGRTSYDDLADATGTTPDEVRTRTERLLADEVIQIVAVTDPVQLGYARQAMLGLEVDTDPHHVGTQVAELDDVIYLVRTDGEMQLLVEVVGASDARLLEVVAQIRRIPGVTRIHTFLCTEVVKENYAFGTA